MAVPTRLEIEATVALPKYKVEIWIPITYGYQGWQTVNNDYVQSVTGGMSSSGTTDNGLSFGSQVDATATIIFSGDAYINYVGNLKHLGVRNLKIRISYGFANSDFIVAFEGPIMDVSFTRFETQVQCGSFIEIMQDFKLYTGVYRNRQIASTSTVATQENPDANGYVGGLINEIFWRAGGRPIEQKGINYNDNDVFFWYTCNQSLFNSEWLWLTGDNLIAELTSLARAAGGQIYQDSKGTIRYVQPLNLADASSTFTYDTSKFGTISVRRGSGDYAKTVRMTSTTRRLEPVQTVYEESTPRQLLPGTNIILEMETQLPIYIWYDFQAFNVFKASYSNGNVAIPTVMYNVFTAQKAIMQISNDSTLPMYIHSIKLRGRPISAQDEISTYYSATYPAAPTPERIIENNVYVQNERHAAALVRMSWDFYSEARRIITLTDVGYDPDRYIGETIIINEPNTEIFNSVCRVIGINHDLTGKTMEIEAVEIDNNIPKRSNMFIIGTGYFSNEVKLLSY